MTGEELEPGDQAGDYVIRGRLSAGGYGTVYAAEHPVLARRAAVKVLRGELAASRVHVERFVQEARAVNQIRHPGIVDIFELGVLADGRPYLVMELLEGQTLAALLAAQGRLTAPELLELAAPVCEALHAAHQAGFVHRDLKAANVMVLDGPRRVVKLLDFGIAKLLQPEPGAPQLTAVSARIGTPAAMAPEQIEGRPVDARTDVYALGVLLYQMVTGTTPFQAAGGLELEAMHLRTPPPPPSTHAPVGAPLEAVILRCLEKSPDQRFPSAAAVLEALRATVGPRPGPSATRAAVAIHVEAQAVTEPDDDTLDAMAAAIDLVEQRLRAAGYLLPLLTASAALGVLPVAGPDADVAPEPRRRALDLALALAAEAAAPAIRLAVSTHTDRVVIRETRAGAEAVSGPLLRVATWAGEPGHVTATAVMVEGLDAKGLVIR